MNYRLLYFGILFTIFISSCAPTLSEVWMNKDGSGKVTSQIDLGDMAAMATTMIEQLDNSEPESTEPFDFVEPTNSEDTGFGSMKGDLFQESESMDTVINLLDSAPDSIKRFLQYPEIADKFQMHMKFDENTKEGVMSFSFTYDSPDDMEKLISDLTIAASSEDPTTTVDAEAMKKLFLDYNADLENGIVRIQNTDIMQSLEDEDMLDQELMNSLDSLQNMSPDEPGYAMFEMMFGGESKTIIHLPGKVEFTNDPKAIIEGNTVTFIDNLFQDLLDGKEMKKGTERIIKFKN